MADLIASLDRREEMGVLLKSFLDERVERVLLKGKHEMSADNMEIGRRSVLHDCLWDWQAVVKGNKFDFDIVRDEVEKIVASKSWEEQDGWGRRSGWGWGWPASRHDRGDRLDEMVARLVGKGKKYQEAMAQELLALRDKGIADKDCEEAYALLLKGAEQKCRVRREKSSMGPSGAGAGSKQRVRGGTDFLQEVTLSVREGADQRLVAVWVMGLRYFFPDVADRVVDRVPVMRLEVLDWAGRAAEPGTDLGWVFAQSLMRMSLEALSSVGPQVEMTLHQEEYGGGNYVAFGVRAVLQPWMGKMEAQVLEHLSHMHWDVDEQDDDPLMDTHVELTWVEVETADKSPGDVAREKAQRKKQKADALEEQRKQVQPGDEFKLVEFEVKELCKGEGELYYPARWLELQEEVRDELGMSAKEFFNQCSVTAEDVLSAHWKNRNRVARKALDEAGFEEADEQAVVSAAVVARAGKLKEAKGLRVRLLIDAATHATVVELVRTSESVGGFLERATSVVADTVEFELPVRWRTAGETETLGYDPHAGPCLTLCTKPKRLMVARTLTERDRSIESWARKRGVEVVRPKSGVEGGGTEIRLWRSDLEDAVRPRAPSEDGRPWKKVEGMTLEAVSRNLKSICWGLNELEGSREGGWSVPRCLYPASVSRKGADVAQWRAWRKSVLDGVVVCKDC